MKLFKVHNFNDSPGHSVETRRRGRGRGQVAFCLLRGRVPVKSVQSSLVKYLEISSHLSSDFCCWQILFLVMMNPLTFTGSQAPELPFYFGGSPHFLKWPMLTLDKHPPLFISFFLVKTRNLHPPQCTSSTTSLVGDWGVFMLVPADESWSL